MGAVIDYLKSHVKLQHVNLLTDIFAVLATYGRSRTEYDFTNASLQNVVDHFAVPLMKADVDLMVLEEEWLDMVYYAKTYLNLVQG